MQVHFKRVPGLGCVYGTKQVIGWPFGPSDLAPPLQLELQVRTLTTSPVVLISPSSAAELVALTVGGTAHVAQARRRTRPTGTKACLDLIRSMAKKARAAIKRKLESERPAVARHLGAVAPVIIAELLLEIAFFA